MEEWMQMGGLMVVGALICAICMDAIIDALDWLAEMAQRKNHDDFRK